MLDVTKVDLWCAPIDDRPGALLEKIEPLVKAGADLDLLLARATTETPGRGVMLLSPVKGERQLQAAEAVGLQRNDQCFALCIEGPDEPGSIYRILYALKEEQINIEEVSATSWMGQFTVYLIFDTADKADRAANRLKRPV